MAFFAIFVTTLYATAVVPYTVYRLRAGPLELQGVSSVLGSCTAVPDPGATTSG